MKLTDTFLRGVKPSGSVKKYSDGEGLYLHVSPTGGRLWRMAYRFGGKQKTLSFGAYPEVPLSEARKFRLEAKGLLAKGIDPGEHKRAVKVAVRAEAENAFEVVAREWFNKRKASWAQSHATKVIARLEKDIFPIVGGKPIGSITASELLAALRRIEARGAIDTAHRALQTCGQIFRYAIATGRAERDTAADLRDALSPVRGGNFASIKETVRQYVVHQKRQSDPNCQANPST